MTKQDFINKYGVEAYERYLEQMRRRSKQYYTVNRESILEQQKQYYTENREARLEQKKQYNAAHKEQKKQYNAAHKEQKKQYRTTPIGRANSLARSYRQTDKQKGFLNVDNQVDSNFILNNIFNSSCIYCGESDWTKLGCDRINNDKPHTIDNVVCSCWDCNKKRKSMNFDAFMAMKRNSA